MVQIVVRPLDRIMERYGKALGELSGAKAHRVMARALNYEGRRAFVAVKRVLRVQTSIPRPDIEQSTRFQQASTSVGGSLEIAIIGRGKELSLKRFGARQFKAGTRATVWGRRQMFVGAFMGPRPGTVAARLGGHVYHRTGKSRLPIEKLFGPSVPRELVKDQSKQTFYASTFRIVDRVGKEIAAVMRGF